MKTHTRQLLPVTLLCMAIVSAGALVAMWPYYYPRSHYEGDGVMRKAGAFGPYGVTLPECDLTAGAEYRWPLGGLPNQSSILTLVSDYRDADVGQDVPVVALTLVDEGDRVIAQSNGRLDCAFRAIAFRPALGARYYVMLRVVRVPTRQILGKAYVSVSGYQ